VGRKIREPALIDDSGFDDLASELNEPSTLELGAADVDWEWFDEELKESVEALSPDLREVLLLWSLEGLSYKEIAEVCECAMGTVMSRLYRARQQVGTRLAAYAREHRLRTDRFES
jgi:RNA polymerase sigma-70 factor (ECF subfamily)